MHKFIKVVLDLFDGEGGGDGTTGGETSTSSDAAMKSGDLSNVRYGVQTDEGAPDDEADAEPDEGDEPLSLDERRKAYNEFIHSDDYKEFYTEDTQKMINRRFKEVKNLEKQIADFQPILSMLSQMYGVDNVDSLKQAIENDNTIWENKAFEAGMDVEQFKKLQKLEIANRDLQAQRDQQIFNDNVNRQMQAWEEQAELTQQFYPDFDLEVEKANPKFRDLLMAHIDVKTAYETVHHDELMRDAMNFQEQRTAKAVTDNIRAKGIRPLENGTSQQGAFIVKNDVNALSKEDRAEIARRVARGEVISF